MVLALQSPIARALIMSSWNLRIVISDNVYYLWTDGGDVLHIWAADGYDEWDEVGWAVNKRKDGLKPSGVGLPEKVLDELVVMRLAQMLEEGLVDEAIERAISKHGGNYGCYPLAHNAEHLKEALKGVKITSSFRVPESQIRRAEESFE
ncbi:MAG: hypothetical protein WKF84_30275 [Pyrinomonadaceae bacterium]